MEPIEGVGGKRWAKMLCFISLSWAHRSEAELLTPKSTQTMRADFTHVQAQVWSLGLCTGGGVNHLSISSCFYEILQHPLHLLPQGHQNQKKPSYPMVCSGRETVWWLQSYASRTLFGHLCLRKGWPVAGTIHSQSSESQSLQKQSQLVYELPYRLTYEPGNQISLQKVRYQDR